VPRHGRLRDEIDELFGFVCRKPIPYELYETIRDGGKWPEDVEAPAERGMGDNSQNLEPHEALQADINNLADAARDWLKSIGGNITTQEQADKAANYATEFGKLEKRGQDKHKAEKAPHLEAGRAVDAAWKPVIDLADQKKRFMKKTAEAWLIEEKRRLEKIERERIAAERKAAEAEAQAARARGEEAPPPPPPVEEPASVRVSVGTRGKVAIRTRTEYEIVDLPAFAAFLATLPPPPPDFLEACQKLANKMGPANPNLPGVAPKTIEYAA
jgi:hypothetical protein